MVYSFIENYWGKVVVAIVILIMTILIFVQNGRIDKRDDQITTLTAESKLNELQKEALRKAILDQNKAVEKQRIDAEKRAAKFEAESKRIWSDFERTKLEVQNLSGDSECEAMRKIVREAV